MLSHGKWRENELHIYVLRLRPGSEITILISLLRQRITSQCRWCYSTLQGRADVGGGARGAMAPPKFSRITIGGGLPNVSA